MNKNTKLFAQQIYKKASTLFPGVAALEEASCSAILETMDKAGSELAGLILGFVLIENLKILPDGALCVENSFNLIEKKNMTNGKVTLDENAFKRVWKGTLFDHKLLGGVRLAFKLDREVKRWYEVFKNCVSTDEYLYIKDDYQGRLLLAGWLAHPGTILYYCPGKVTPLQPDGVYIRVQSTSNPAVNLAVLSQLVSDIAVLVPRSAEDAGGSIRYLPHWLGLAPVVQENKLTTLIPTELCPYSAGLIAENQEISTDNNWNVRYFGSRGERLCVGPLTFGLPMIPLSGYARSIIRQAIKSQANYNFGPFGAKLILDKKQPENAQLFLNLACSFVFYSLRDQSWLLNWQMYQLFSDRKHLKLYEKHIKLHPQNFGLLVPEGGTDRQYRKNVKSRRNELITFRSGVDLDTDATIDFSSLAKKVSFCPADLRSGNLLRPGNNALNAMFGPGDSGYYGDFADIARRFTRRARSIQGTLNILTNSSYPYDAPLFTALRLFEHRERVLNGATALVFCYAYCCCSCIRQLN